MDVYCVSKNTKLGVLCLAPLALHCVPLQRQIDERSSK